MLQWFDPASKSGLGALVFLSGAAAIFVAGRFLVIYSVFALFGASNLFVWNFLGKACILIAQGMLAFAVARICWAALGAMGVHAPAMQFGLAAVPAVAVAFFFWSHVASPQAPPEAVAPGAVAPEAAAPSGAVATPTPAPTPPASLGALEPWSDFATSTTGPPRIADEAQLALAADALQRYFDRARVTMAISFGSTIPVRNMNAAVVRALAESGDAQIDEANATLRPLQPSGLYVMGRYRMLGVDRLEKLPPQGRDTDIVRVYYRRVLEPTPFGNRLLAAGWESPAARITLARCDTFCPPPAGFNRAAQASVASVATIMFQNKTWTGRDVDESEAATLWIPPQTGPLPRATPLSLSALDPYVTQANASQDMVYGYLGVRAPKRASRPTESPQPTAESIAQAGAFVQASLNARPTFIVEPPDFGPSPSARDAVVIAALRADGDLAPVHATGAAALNDKGKALLTNTGALITGAYRVEATGLERVGDAGFGIDCLAIHYQRSVVLNAVGEALKRAGFPYTTQNYVYSLLDEGTVTATLSNQQGYGWTFQRPDADLAGDHAKACNVYIY